LPVDYPKNNSKSRWNRNPDSMSSYPVHANPVPTCESNFFEAIMNAEFDYDLRPDQWEALKALRLPAAERRIRDRRVVESLVALQLAVLNSDGAVITPKGRSVLLRGSPRLWDVAA
jgi:hypothetical protein